MTTAGENVPQNSVGGTPETKPVEGEPVENEGTQQEPSTDDGQSGTEDTQEGGEPSGAELPEGVTSEMLQKAGYVSDKEYKDLQREYGSRTETDKALQERFDGFGGVEKAQEMLAYLQGNEEFANWAKAQQEGRIMGQKAEDIDPETKKAMEIVEKIADERIATAMREQVDPLASTYKENLLKSNMAQLSDKYPDWMEMKDTMATISESLPAEMQDNPSLGDLESLYIQALVKSGKITDFGKGIYETELKNAKAKNVDKPASSKPGTTTNASSMSEAYKLAKKSTGQSFGS